MTRMSTPCSSRWVANLCRNVWTVTDLLSPAASAGQLQRPLGHRPGRIAAGKQPVRWPCRSPVVAKNAEQLAGQDPIAILAPFALPHADHHARAVDILGLRRSRQLVRARRAAPAPKVETSAAEAIASLRQQGWPPHPRGDPSLHAGNQESGSAAVEPSRSI